MGDMGDMGRYGEMRGDVSVLAALCSTKCKGKSGEIWGDMARCKGKSGLV